MIRIGGVELIKLDWICDDCGTVGTYEGLSDYPLDVSEMIPLKYKKCKSIFELVIRHY